MTTQTIKQGDGRVETTGAPWRGIGPFLFTGHHVDHYPRGNDQLGPDADLSGRPLGQDFNNRAGWSMYHGHEVPGFPAHPHRGFETITLVTQGYVDHADSTGASARYGKGDVQWVTAGKGVSHGEMFPLVNAEGDNPFELYQVWLNLPARSKGVDPEFTMQWAEQIPTVRVRTQEGSEAVVSVIAGAFGEVKPLAPPRNSWAAEADSDVALWRITLEPHAVLELPDVNTDATERLVVVHGSPEAKARIAGHEVVDGQSFEQTARGTLLVEAGEHGATLMVLQGVAIGEPVVQQGPFVMNTHAEIRQAHSDWNRTQFGGWFWNTNAVVHPREAARFADYGNGRIEYPES